VERSLTLRFGDLMRYPKTEVTSFHQCAGSPLAPREPTRRICQRQCGGRAARRRACRLPAERASEVHLCPHGADFGEFAARPVDAYIKDLPIARVEADALIAYEMNGHALAPEHGFPARLVVARISKAPTASNGPTRMTLAATARAGDHSPPAGYNDPVLDDEDRDTG
jgi:DMSO/TMAO reductase YedYZ molybdopterin-dependent catalytic subunit